MRLTLDRRHRGVRAMTRQCLYVPPPPDVVTVPLSRNQSGNKFTSPGQYLKVSLIERVLPRPSITHTADRPESTLSCERVPSPQQTNAL